MTLAPGIKNIKYADLAHFYEMQKKFDLAEENYLKSISSAPETLEPLMNLAEFYVRINKMDKAVSEMDKALALKKETPKVLSALGQIYFHFNNIQKAEEYVGLALQKNSDFVDALYLKGRILMYQNNFSAAFDRFDKIIELDLGCPKNHFLSQFLCSVFGTGDIDQITSLDWALEQINESQKVSKHKWHIWTPQT